MDRRPRNWPANGQALVEFALVFPLILLLLLGVLDFGRYIFADNEVTNAAREGIRTAIVNQNAPDIRNRVQQQSTAIDIAVTPPVCDAGTNLPSAADPSGVCIKFVDQDALTTACNPLYVGCMAWVTVKYTFTPVTPVIGDIVGSRVVISTAKQPIESVCIASTGCPVR
jgi:Flp pilus assembly protein TadG